ncbi:MULTISPECIES: autotransporter domain-containing protein [unclassified Sphingomonas]|uniref:autotransporter domain-containing protein n=1 Tax=unclassified Sphingomonas TaxID=196159 RepID=UPI00226A2718|nr:MULTISPECIES: autotransporter domain-containing protein [unclassified Sphingomonas]
MVDSSIRAVARRALLATTALVALPGIAAAQDGPTGMYNEAQNGSVAPAGMINEPSIIISQPGTPTTALDTGGVTGVGQMVVDQQNGFIGLCTGTLINPRTVLFAAHCVNENPAGTGVQDPWGYGAAQGGIPIAFGFQANNNVAGNSAFGRWLNGALKYQTSTSNYLYNVNQVIYNPASVALGIANNFLQGDVALASLDTPAANVPTWAILLSALPAPSAISATAGTGYHVAEIGYGTNGVGTTGATGGIDYRRRAAENYVGLLGSLDDVDLFLFGEPDGLPQNLYQLDFDDPRRGTAAASPFDFNAFKDNALPSEGITGSGDSGGPLVIDRAFAKQVVIGVLSGGSRYFNAQPSGSYGTTSFYQPLYLFWDYIAANNPYRYAAAKAGDGNWTDPTHWQTLVDPAYQVLVNGALVNGVPASPGEGINGTSGKFGQICFEQGGASDCYDNATGVETVNGVPVDATVPAGDAAAVKVADATSTTTAATGGRADGMTVTREAQAGSATASLAATDVTAAASGDAVAAALPAATLANGLPGATNFVPNNVDPNAATKTNARYFDITLSAAGTTTLNSAVTIDRFTVSGAQSRLNVTSTGSLTSLMAVNQFNGVVQVDGTLTSQGDYLLLSGGLTGAGRINAPYFTNATGMIAPGTIGTVGTLTFGGNVVLSSGSTLLVDVGPSGASDRIAVVKTTATDGLASIGGRVGFAPVAGYTIRSGDVYTILTAAGGVTGTFQTASPLSAILTPQYIYSANAVQARIIAGLYANVVANTPIQTAYAGLLDRNRATSYANLSTLYGILDMQSAGTIQSTLGGLAPRTQTLKYALGTTATDNMARFYRQRLAGIDPRTTMGGTLTVIGKPQQFASLLASDLPASQQVASDSTGTSVSEGVLPKNVGVFIAGGYVDGSSRSMPTAVPFGGHDQFDGFYIAGGIESQVSEHGVIGFGFGYTKLDGTTGGVAQQAHGNLYQGTLYGKLQSDAGLTLDTQFSAGVFQARTFRTVSLAGSSFGLRSRDNALAISAEVGISEMFDLGSVQAGPRAAFRVNHIGFTPTIETGGGPALRSDRDDLESQQARVGLQIGGGVGFKPFASAYYVHDFKDRPGVFTANFVGGAGPSAAFALASQDQDWAEIAGGVTYSMGNVDLSVSADTTIERKDVKNQAYRGAVTFHF